MNIKLGVKPQARSCYQLCAFVNNQNPISTLFKNYKLIFGFQNPRKILDLVLPSLWFCSIEQSKKFPANSCPQNHFVMGINYFIFTRSKSNSSSFPSGEVINNFAFEFWSIFSIGNLYTNPATKAGSSG